jgi:hypothetical protein
MGTNPRCHFRPVLLQTLQIPLRRRFRLRQFISRHQQLSFRPWSNKTVTPMTREEPLATALNRLRKSERSFAQQSRRAIDSETTAGRDGPQSPILRTENFSISAQAEQTLNCAFQDNWRGCVSSRLSQSGGRVLSRLLLPF